jgi:RNA polymerase sigma factor (TIGR02999 family)
MAVNRTDSHFESIVALADNGDPLAAREVFNILYGELHRLAKRELYRHGAALSLGATTLLHEAFLDISAREDISFPDRARFMGYAARAMRGLIIDYARSRQALKRGGAFEITSLPTDIADQVADSVELTGIGDALEQLALTEPSLAQLVDLKFFCGFTFAEIAAMRGVSERTVQRDWEKARIYLHHSLRDDAALT